jgi:hypothetical protein
MVKQAAKWRPDSTQLRVERVQTGVRMERRMVKVLKALAEYLGMSLGDLLEGIILHAFEGKPPFTKTTLYRISQLKEVYGLDYDSSVSHQLIDDSRPEGR